MAIAADALDDMQELQKTVVGVTLVSDPTMKVSDAWGLKVAGAEHPSPGTFVVDKAGMVTYRRLEQPGSDWPTWEELAAALGKG